MLKSNQQIIFQLTIFVSYLGDTEAEQAVLASLKDIEQAIDTFRERESNAGTGRSSVNNSRLSHQSKQGGRQGRGRKKGKGQRSASEHPPRSATGSRAGGRSTTLSPIGRDRNNKGEGQKAFVTEKELLERHGYTHSNYEGGETKSNFTSDGASKAVTVSQWRQWRIMQHFVCFSLLCLYLFIISMPTDRKTPYIKLYFNVQYRYIHDAKFHRCAKNVIEYIATQCEHVRLLTQRLSN